MGFTIILIALISTIDYLSIPELTFSLFYIVPVGIAAWLGSQHLGYLTSVFTAMAWLRVDLAVGMESDVHPCIPYWNMLMRLGLFLTIVQLISAQKTAYEREKRLASIDGLTGVYNRRFFMDALEIEASRARRYHHPLTLVYLDVDDFKQINDHWGHNEGDRVLQHIAATLKPSLRSTDIVARLGGDEFAILLPLTGYDDAQNVLPRLQQQLLKLNKSEGCAVSFSIGAVTFITMPESIDALISQADHLMYSVKRQGKNRMEYKLVSDESVSSST